MQFTKYTSLKEAILSVYRNTGIEDEVNIEDCAYWCYEALEAISCPLFYVPKVIGFKGDPAYEMENYRVDLPIGFHKLVALTVDNKTAIPASNTFIHLLDGGCCGIDSQNSSSYDLFYDNFGNIFSPQAPPLLTTSQSSTEPITFVMNSSTITFNKKEGKVCMAYTSFPVDEEGFPKIPDDAKIKAAVVMYITERLDYRAWRTGKLTDKMYQDSKRERNWAIAAAYNYVRTADIHQMESMKNMLIKMVVRKDEYMNNFKNMSKQGYRGRY